jgi:CRISPR-associated protein Cmr6
MREIKEDYRLYNPDDTQKLLKDRNIISKIGKYEYDQRRRKEEKKDWYYTSLDVVKNPALIFGKFIPYTLEKEENENKDKYLQLVIKETNFLLRDTDLDLLKNLHKRIEYWIKNTGNNFEKFEATTSWRLVIGLGASHPQETSMTLHHIYGIPYIPGSAIKGVTRHWAVLKFADNNRKDNEEFEDAIKRVAEALENGDDLGIKVDEINFKDLIEIFGTQEKQGKVIFFDAYPVEDIELKIDVMTPHYLEYYSKGQPPADWQNPVPIEFLTVENTKFEFYLASINKDDSDKHLLNKARKLLLEALTKYGIGAKTSLGYGLFSEY